MGTSESVVIQCEYLSRLTNSACYNQKMDKSDNMYTDHSDDEIKIGDLELEKPIFNDIFQGVEEYPPHQEEQIFKMKCTEMQELVDEIWIQKSKKAFEEEFHDVFVEVDPKIQKKNTNLHKFIIKIFLNHYLDFQAENPESTSYEEFMNPVVKELKKVGYRHYTVSSLKLLFGGDGEHCLRNRKLLQKILSDTDLMWKEIEGNCQIKSNSDKKHKRIACKVMSLRSLSPLLMERLQTK